MSDFFDDEDIVETKSFFDDEDVADYEPSKLETVARLGGQGATAGFLDEMLATLGTKGASPSQIVAEPEKAIEIEKELFKQYEQNLAGERAKTKAAEEANPKTALAAELVGGALPALLTGGGTAAAAVVKQGSKQALKEAAKIGAKYGAVSGAGYSEAETPLGVAEDIATGGAVGGITGAALPAIGKGAKDLAKVTGRGTKDLLSSLIPESEAIKAGFKYGTQGKKLQQDVVDDEIIDISKKILGNLQNVKNSKNLKDVKKRLDGLGIKVNTKKAVDRAIDDLEKISKNDMLDIQNKELLPKLKKLTGVDLEGEKLTEKAIKNAIKKQDQNEKFIKNTLSNEIKFDPKITKSITQEGRPLVSTTDLGSGKVTTLVGNMVGRAEKDLGNMTVSEVEALRKQLNVFTKLAKTQGLDGDPVMVRAKRLAVELKDLTNEAIEQTAGKDLSTANKKMSDLLTAEQLLGIDKSKFVRNEDRMLEQARKIGEKLGFKKGFSGREEEKRAAELLGSNIIEPEDAAQLGLIKELNTVMGRESQENISRAGIYKKLVGDVPNLAGRGVRRVSDVVSPAKKASDEIGQMTQEQYMNFSQKLANSPSQGLKIIGERLLEAGNLDEMAKSQLMFSLSQSPAFRELVKRETGEADKQLNSMISPEETTTDVDSPKSSEDQNREPSMSDFLKEKEGGTALVGYVPKNSSKSGVTIATGLDLANFDLESLVISDELKNKLSEYKGVTGKDAVKIAANLKITEKEAKEIDEAMDVYNSGKIDSKMKSLPKEYQNDDFKEGLESMLHNIPAGANKLIQRVNSGNVDEAIDKGVEYNKTGGKFASGLLQRRMEELYKMFPKKANLIQSEGKIEYDRNKSQTKRSWEDINTIKEKVQALEKDIDRVNQQQSSGDSTPISQIDDMLGRINELNIAQEDVDEIENEAINMEGFSDGERLKQLLKEKLDIN